MIQPENIVWDQTISILKLCGSGVRSFLNGQTTSNLNSIEASTIFRTCWLNTKGKVRALLEIKILADSAEIIVLSGDIYTLNEQFEKVIFPADKVEIITGNQVRRIQKLDSNNLNRFDNIIWLNPGDPLPRCYSDMKIATKEQLERWRVNNLLPISSAEINSQNNPFEIGLRELIDMKKGCYLGQESISRFDKAKDREKNLIMWESNNIVIVGSKLYNLPRIDEVKKIVGTITSAIPKGDGLRYIGLAIVKSPFFLEDQLSLEDNAQVLIIKHI